ncbi:MAG: tripartite tricarboxylate transporter permease [Firmicutes bacterium]|jgi:putative tricarboxylic transport membrane protein|nr:tripartite tricarboxylate transporter permease [Bacillota bacterium]MDH7494754.1 tripartite tricarboxylate transporter permease [Bacillota bacterium]
MEALATGIQVVFQPGTLVLMVAGVVAGIVVGAIPGLTATMAMALMTPFTFAMSSGVAISVLLAIYVGAISGGLISAILLKIPGTPSSITTTFDGFPMARRGLAGQALGTAIISSFIGGAISFVVLMLVSPQLARFALKFGPHEYFAVGILGLSTIVSIGGNSPIKGLIAGAFGLLLATVGLDVVTGIPRFTFGVVELTSGFDFVAVLIGLFAISQVLTDIENIYRKTEVGAKIGNLFPSLSELKRNVTNFLRSGLIGTWIGVLPGAGGSIASLMAYDQAKRFSKTPEKFGTGFVDGIVASETANNAVIGGALIPLLTLGIPGDTPAAVLLAALTLHGLQPGPLLYRTNPEVFQTVFISLCVANLMMILIEMAGIRVFIKILRIPKYILLPLIVGMCVVGSYSINNRFLDVWTMFGFGVLGYLMEKHGFPVAPTVLGVVLGPMIEGEFRRALFISRGNLASFITRPISAAVLVLTVVMLVLPRLRSQRGGARGTRCA